MTEDELAALIERNEARKERYARVNYSKQETSPAVDIDNLLAWIADLQSALLDQWQPITDDLPATDDSVLLTDGKTVYEGVRAYRYDDEDTVRFETSSGWPLNNMTYWIPKPQPPIARKP